MYTIVSVNMTNKGSTGTIVKKLAEAAHENGYKFIQAYGIYKDTPKPVGDEIGIGTNFTRWWSAKLAALTDLHGCFSLIATISFLKKLKQIKPDIIHLHNLHGNYINIILLFAYIRKNRIKVVWTLHDCWSFTGHCPHFTMIGCGKWKTGCGRCAQYKDYPRSLIDLSSFMWKLKRRTFSGVQDMVIITPSEWLKGLVRDSYLSEYPVEVINNGINLNLFKPVMSDYRDKILNGGGKIVLGVSMGWTVKKGIDVLTELRSYLDDEYLIVIVGASAQEIRSFPPGIIGLSEVKNERELAKIYSAADVLVNPTREEVLGMVNIEALACGTPVITFRSGGNVECIDKLSGVVVNTEKSGDCIGDIAKEIRSICVDKSIDPVNCISRSRKFSSDIMCRSYYNVFKRML